MASFLYTALVQQTRGSTVTKYYFFGGQRVAMRAGGVLTYLHSDHLGSTALATNTSGGVHSSEQYYAYGKPDRLGAGVNLPTDNTYTGQKRDGSGLMYYGARFYDPSIGTFISADTIVPSPGLASDYNRYAYARGNSMLYTDPTGHIPEREACEILNACSMDEFTQQYGSELAELLYGTDITWGALLSWGDGNLGMLLLMGNSDDGYQGVIWGIEGSVVGSPVWLDSFQGASSQGVQAVINPNYGSIYDLPIAENYSQSYFPTTYTDISEMWWIGVVPNAAKAGATKGLTYAAPRVLKAMGMVSTASSLADLADDLTVTGMVDGIEYMTNGNAPGWVHDAASGFDYWWPKTMGSAWTTYPVMRFSQYGSASFTLHLLGPGGTQ